MCLYVLLFLKNQCSHDVENIIAHKTSCPFFKKVRYICIRTYLFYRFIHITITGYPSIKNTGNQAIIFSVNEHERHYLSELKLTHGDTHDEPTI